MKFDYEIDEDHNLEIDEIEFGEFEFDDDHEVEFDDPLLNMFVSFCSFRFYFL